MPEHAKRFVAGGVGGVLPTSVTLATMLTSDPTSRVIEDITLGFYAGLAIFFFIGAVVSILTVEESKKLRDAVIAGIAAPALITSVGAGFDKSQENVMLFNGGLISSVYASENKIAAELDKTYEYKIISVPIGSNDWRTQSLSYNLVFENNSGEKTKFTVGAGSADQIEFHSYTPLQTVWVESRNGRIVSQSNINSNSSGELIVRPRVESKIDLLWVLGTKGKAEVVGAELQFLPQQTKIKNEPPLE